MKIETHPIDRVRTYLRSFHSKVWVWLGYYEYPRRGMFEERDVRQVDLNDLAAELARAESATGQRDLAFHSQIAMHGVGVQSHLVLLDLVGPWRETFEDCLSEELARVGCLDAAIYSSGRSFHVYGFGLLSRSAWRELMCRLLIVNPRRSDAVVEPHRIGEVLLALSALDSAASGEMRMRDYEVCLSKCEEEIRALEHVGRGEGGRQHSKADLRRQWSTLWLRSCEMLLRNPPSEEDVIDSRWIAHRLIAGYGALRWTCRQQGYRAEPRFWKVMAIPSRGNQLVGDREAK